MRQVDLAGELMAKHKTKSWWVKPWLYGFWAVLSAFALMLIAQFGSQVLPAGQAATADTSAGIGFEAYLCSAISYANFLVGMLAALTVIIAGITYATSAGGKEGIKTSKDMIIAAVAGVALYAMGHLLLGACGTGTGGLITRFFSGGTPIIPS
ncbi:MAG: hypothetical protein VE99_C0001G0147 [candidate division Kazan bacterium GW2011_GWC1_52_13]|uniref:Uncharacterized protein n=2 Tax=Bacteria division Kazan-3B-28 TaxID=1798534 RepID=A0A0G1X758_UNCK3|nr:MAG: hypothetical protein VE99_C0001G0147 [candidate division Kazan bacterium GW2011_GWC1_52_13]KKW26816.1 MAG: hypothetical protein VF00_C0002G0141 [candidate division Kazan bacterium GW2011_GWB1_52_7]